VSNQDTVNQLELEKWRALYDLTQANLARASDQWQTLDNKAMNYSTLLGVVVAAAALSLDSVVDSFGKPYGWVFFIPYGLLWIAAPSAFICFVLALRLTSTQTPAYGPALLDHFRAHSYVDVLYSMSRRFSEATVRHRRGAERKVVLAARGYGLFLATLALAMISSVSYLALGIMETRMADQPDAQTTTPAVVPSPTPQPSPQFTPNTAVIGPANVQEQRGFEGGQTKAEPQPPGKKDE
jgi:hypothetical protein